MPADAKRLGIDHSTLDYNDQSTGVGGDCKEHIARAKLIVSDQSMAYGYVFPIGIAENKPELEEAPSLLGMDILRRWRVLFDYSNRQVQIWIQIADEERPLS
jgi:hypothetical protein